MTDGLSINRKGRMQAAAWWNGTSQAGGMGRSQRARPTGPTVGGERERQWGMRTGRLSRQPGDQQVERQFGLDFAGLDADVGRVERTINLR